MSDRQSFAYTRGQSGFWSIVGAFLVLVVLESSVVVLLIVGIVTNPLLERTLLAGYALLAAALVIGLLLAPLWTRHRLAPDAFHLRYGWDKVDLPRHAILQAVPAAERLSTFQPLRAQIDTRRQRLVAAFSEEGQILLTLDGPHTVSVSGTQGDVREVLINVDDRETLLAALGVPAAPAVVDHPPVSGPHVSQAPSSTGTRSRPAEGMPGRAAIRIQGLTRRYGDHVAVDGLTLTVNEGEIYGFLGPNGAGKTTTMKMLVGLLEPSAGEAHIAGHDIWREPLNAKRELGYVADRAILYERLSGREFLHFLAQVRGLPSAESEARIDALLALLELDDRADTACGTYSFGMKRKLALAGALLHQPRVLLLDEPLNGLDPRSARHIKDLFAALAQQGTAIFLSTHDLATAEAVCHRVSILNRGRLVAEGAAEELRAWLAVPDLESVFLNLTREAA